MNAARSEKRKTGLWWAALAITGFVLFAGMNLFRLISGGRTPPQSEAVVPVDVYRADRQTLESRLDLTANVQPLVAVNVYSQVPGQIIETISVEKGDGVRKGDVVAYLQRDIIDAQLAEARAGLAVATAGRGQTQARLAVLEKDRVRLTHLYAEKAVARQQLDHIEAEVTATIQALRLAEAQEHRAEAVIRQLTVQSDKHTIRAPIDGVIAVRQVDPGTLAAPGMPIVSIADESTVKVVFQVTEKDLPRMREGMRVRITADAVPDGEFSGTVTLVSPTVDPATRSAAVEVHIANPHGRLTPGMFARVSILLERRACLVVPAEGVIRVPGTSQRYVFVVEGDHAVQRNVTTGLAEGSLVELTSGVTAGEAVVIKGQGRLREGTSVRVVDTPTAASSNRS